MKKPAFTSFTPDQIARARDYSMIDLAAQAGVKLKRAGQNHVGCCPFHTESSGSFTIFADNGYKCFGGCGASGSSIDFVMAREGLEFPAAVECLLGEKGLEISPEEMARQAKERKAASERRAADQREKDARELGRCHDIVKGSALSVQGTKGEVYYRSRGIRPEGFGGFLSVSDVMFHHGLPYWHQGKTDEGYRWKGDFPCIVARFRDKDGAFRGVHLTYLQPDGSGKLELPDPDAPAKMLNPKKMRGRAKGCAVWLSPPAPCVMITEGLENALVVKMARPNLTVAAALSLDNLAGGALDEGPPHPCPPADKPGLRLPGSTPDPARPGMELPSVLEAVIVVGDNDTKDRRTGRARTALAVAKFRAMGMRCPAAVFPPEGMDLLDWLNDGGLDA